MLRTGGERFLQATFKPAWFQLLQRMLPSSEEELAPVRHVAGARTTAVTPTPALQHR